MIFVKIISTGGNGVFSDAKMKSIHNFAPRIMIKVNICVNPFLKFENKNMRKNAGNGYS